MIYRWLAAPFAAALLFACATPQEAPPAAAAPETPAAPQISHNDYANGANWLCRPGRQDACAQDQSASAVAANGRVTREAFTPNPNAPIDCFYVYPTISLDPTPNSDMNAGPEEVSVINQQFARFSSVCRTFAPIYRQATLGALRANAAAPGSVTPDRQMAYQDVLDAWNYYLAHDNNGRGVVLVGHSQGSGVLSELLRNEIDGKPAQARLISAMLIGTNLAVPLGADVGGAFQHIPACRSATQVGCVISYVSFRDTAPPPAKSRFGAIYDFATRTVRTDQTALCTNPAALAAGGEGVLHSYFETGPSFLMDGGRAFVWATPAPQIATPFVTTPGLITAHCVTEGNRTWLALRANASAGARTDDFPGNVEANGAVLTDWGLHLIDMHAAMGDLISIARQQGAAYVAR